MEVTIRTMLPNLQGSFTMEVDENETVEMFLKQFCSQQQIEYSSSFVLNTTSQESLLKSMRFSTLNVQHGDLFYLTVAGIIFHNRFLRTVIKSCILLVFYTSFPCQNLAEPAKRACFTSPVGAS